MLNHLMTYDIYLRQLVTLALKDKPERPRRYKPSKKARHESEFNRAAGITEENEHLAGFKSKHMMKMMEEEEERRMYDHQQINLQANRLSLDDGDKINQVKPFANIPIDRAARHA